MIFSISQQTPTGAFGTAGSLSDSNIKNILLTQLAGNYFPSIPTSGSNSNAPSLFRGSVSHFQWIEGALWSSCCSWLLYDFCKHLYACIKISRKNMPSIERCKELHVEIKKAFISMISLSGAGASFIRWADRVRLIVLGKYLPLMVKISYASYFISSCFGIDRALNKIKEEKNALQNALNSVDKIKYTHKYRLGWVDLTAHITTLAWVILGIVEFTGVVLHPVLMPSIFMISSALVFTSIGYGVYIATKENTPSRQQPIREL